MPVLEELERRELPSASGWVAQPNADVKPLAAGATAVYAPAQVRHAYGFDKLPFNGAGQTIAIVDAYDDPYIAYDLQRFDGNFGLAAPPSFLKVAPQGMPAANAGWAGEIALDVEWAHAMAPQANILLVEARSAGDTDLLAAVDYARTYPGVSVVSMSWGGAEFFNESAYESYFKSPVDHYSGSGGFGGVTFVASAGDSGAWSGPEWPAVSPSVLAVGGTALSAPGGNYSSESGWSGGGGGYSSYFVEPSYQRGVQATGRRSNPDVAYNADPSTGVYVFNSYAGPSGYSGWWSVGGTSAGAPQWAALIALANQGRAGYGLGSLANPQATIYSLPAADFHVINGGYNGYSVTSGYNPVTGRGSPFADRVVWDLLFSGSSTLTVSNAVTGGATGAARTSTRHAVAESAGAGGDATAFVSPAGASTSTTFAALFAGAFPSGAAPVIPSSVPATDDLFTTREDRAAPALTATDDLLSDVARSFKSSHAHGGTARDASLFDGGLFGTEN